MKIKMILMLAVIIYSTVTEAQEYKIPVENTNDGKISLVNFTGDLPIEGYNGKEIVISNTGDPVSVPERAKGLKPVYSTGVDNTGIGLSVEKSGNQITVTCLLPITRRGEFKIRVPENFALKYESDCSRAGNITINGMKNEIEIKTCHSITLRDVSGPLVLSTIAGDIDIVYAALPVEKPCSISTISGEVDVTLPAKTAVNLKMKSVTGTLFSDFDFPSTDKKMKQVGGNNLDHLLNGGGFDMSLVSVSGNIYLRKGK